MPKTLIIIPTYNESENLEGLIGEIFSVIADVDLLIIDDASADGTGELAERLAANDSRINVLHREGKLGLGTAYIAGFNYALQREYEVVFEMDADYSHNPSYIPDFLQAIQAGADLVIGSRNIAGGGVQGWGPLRHFISKGGSFYSRVLLGLKIRDLTSGYKAFRRNVLTSIDLDTVRSEGYSFQIELTYRTINKGFKVKEIPIVFVDRRAGQSKMSARVFAEAIWMVAAMRLQRLFK